MWCAFCRKEKSTMMLTDHSGNFESCHACAMRIRLTVPIATQGICSYCTYERETVTISHQDKHFTMCHICAVKGGFPGAVATVDQVNMLENWGKKESMVNR